MQRDRSALDPSASRRVDYLKDAVAERLVERLMVTNSYLPEVLLEDMARFIQGEEWGGTSLTKFLFLKQNEKKNKMKNEKK